MPLYGDLKGEFFWLKLVTWPYKAHDSSIVFSIGASVSAAAYVEPIAKCSAIVDTINNFLSVIRATRDKIEEIAMRFYLSRFCCRIAGSSAFGVNLSTNKMNSV